MTKYQEFMKTKTVIFNCEIVTPMFIGDATGDAELRPPAIKAALRFWWRAMNAHLTLDQLREKETEIFGGGGEEAKASKFSILLENVKGEAKPYDYENNPKKTFDFINNNNIGLKYFFYTFLYLKKTGNYLPVDTTFSVKFQYREEAVIKSVLAAFWLLVHLGNLGSRARRGAGSFRVIEEVTNENNPNFLTSIENYRANIATIKNIFGITDNIESTEDSINNGYSHLLNSTVYFSDKSFDTWQKALNDIGNKMKKHRLKGSIARLKYTESAAFGLPIRHNNGKYNVVPLNFERRASPLIIKIEKINDNQYYWVVTHLSGDFLFDEVYTSKLKKSPINNSDATYENDKEVDDSKLIEFLLGLGNTNTLSI